MGKRASVFGLVALLALGAGAKPAHAEDPSVWAGKLADALRRADYEAIFTALIALKEKDFVDQLADDPKACHTAMRGVAKSIGKLAGDADSFATHVLESLNALGKALKEKHADDPATSRALGALHAAQAHFAWISGKDFELDDWEQALSLTAKTYPSGSGPVAADDADAAADGCIWMREAYRHPKLKADSTTLSALEPSADALIEAASKCTGDDPHAEVIRANGRLLAAQRAFRSGQNPKAAAILETLLTPLAPIASANSDAVVTSIYNDAVTFAKNNKIPAKGDLVFATGASTAGGLTYHVPAGSRWHTSGAGGGHMDLGGFYAYDTMGRSVRSVSLEEFRWDHNYIISDKEQTGGDNARGLAKMFLKDHKTDFATFKEIPLAHSMFAKKLPPGQIFELVGADGNGNYKRVRAIFVKGKEHQVTYGITITDLEDFGKTDAEMEAILDTFLETKK